ncbi:MAG: TonB-dependent receptor [Porphyromonadaceae bacterium]|nr:TonB-dependent receptor [Porphyromonadaceae bacterium]
MEKKLILALLAAGLATVQLQATQHPADSLQQLSELTVYGTRTIVPLKKIPSKVELIQAPVLERSSSLNLGDLLKAHSSVDVVQYPGFLTNIGMRGLRPNGRYVMVLTNGIPTGTENVSSLGISDIYQVEVLKGPFSAIYGTGAMGGVINLVTRKSKGDITGAASVSYGSYSTARGSLTLGGGIVGGLSFDASLAYNAQGKDYISGSKYLISKTELERTILDPKTQAAAKRGSQYKSMTGRIRLGYDFSPEWSLNLYNSLFSANNLPIGSHHWFTGPLTGKDLNRYSTSLELSGRLAGHALQFTPYYNLERANYLNKYDSPDAIATTKTKVKTLGFLLQDNISIAGQKLTIGLDGQRMDRESLSFDGQTGQGKKPYQPAYGTRTLGALAQSNLGFFGDRLNLSLGARLDYIKFLLEADPYLKNTSKTETYLNVTPNIGLKYELIPGLLLHATAGGGFSAPDAYQKSGEYEGDYGKTRGNPELKPERSFTIDGGIGYSNQKLGLSVDATYFHTDIRDLIYSVSGADKVKTFANGDKARLSGLEFLISYDFGSLVNYDFSLRTYLNATMMLDRKMYNQKADIWDEMLLVRKQNITFGIDFKHRDLEIDLKGRYAGPSIDNNWNTRDGASNTVIRPELPKLLAAEYPEIAKNRQILNPRFMTLDASAHYTFFDKLRLSVHLNNLLDEHYFEKDGYNMPGRNFLVGLSYRF